MSNTAHKWASRLAHLSISSTVVFTASHHSPFARQPFIFSDARLLDDSFERAGLDSSRSMERNANLPKRATGATDVVIMTPSCVI